MNTKFELYLALGVSALLATRALDELPAPDPANDAVPTLPHYLDEIMVQTPEGPEAFAFDSGPRGRWQGEPLSAIRGAFAPSRPGRSLGLRMSGNDAEIIAHPGVFALIGQPGTGKTTLIRRVLRPALREEGGSYTVLSFAEIPESTDPDELLSVAGRPMWRVMQELAVALLTPGFGVIELDAMRPWVYGKSLGGTGEGGLDRMLMAQLTALSNVAAVCGKIIIAVINPMSLKDETHQSLITGLLSGVPLTFAAPFTTGGQQYSEQGRVFDVYQRGSGVDRASAQGKVIVPASVLDAPSTQPIGAPPVVLRVTMPSASASFNDLT